MSNFLSGAIIAAGRGERLRSATGGLPKPLVEIDNESLLTRQACLMLRTGLHPIHIIVNCETADLMDRRKLALPREVDLIIADTGSSMESLLVLGECVTSQQFVLATVDSIVDPEEFQRFVDYGRRVTVQPYLLDGVLGVVKWRGDRRPLFAEINQGGLITRVGEQTQALVTAGVYFLPARIFTYAQEARLLKLGALREFLSLLLERGLQLGAYELLSAIDIDEEADLIAARIFFERQSRARASE